MHRVVRGSLNAAGKRFAIVASRFNEFVTQKLVSGAVDAILRNGGSEQGIVEIWVPGAWEIPAAAQKIARRGDVHAVVCIGCVIRGDTPHFEYVAGAAADGAARVGLDSGIPLTFGVLTTDTLDQALERAGGKVGNKGAEAALAAIEMANLLDSI